MKRKERRVGRTAHVSTAFKYQPLTTRTMEVTYHINGT